MVIAGTLLAWAVLFRVWSNALFAALAAYLSAWLTLVSWGLHTLHQWAPSLRSYPYTLPDVRQSGVVPHQPLQEQRQEGQDQQQQQAYRPQKQQQQQPQHHRRLQEIQHNVSTEHDVSSMSESPLQSSNGTSSNSNGTSSSKDGAEHLLTSIAQAAEQRMLQAFSDAGATHEGMPGAAAVWVTSLMLAKRLSEPGLSKPPQQQSSRRSSVSVCPPPLEYEASDELQQELEAAAPEAFMCPLGRVLMVDPVFTPSGFTYHRPCITRYVARTGRDPAHDATPLSPSQLCPNVNMRDQIASWLQRQGVHT